MLKRKLKDHHYAKPTYNDIKTALICAMLHDVMMICAEIGNIRRDSIEIIAPNNKS